MNYCDLNESINEWQSEEFFIPYRSPIDNRVHRYFPDFLIKYKDSKKRLRTMVVDVKPKKETKMPPTNPKKRTKSWAYSVRNWAINQAKWKAAKEYCKDRNYEFKIMTEDDLGIKKCQGKHSKKEEKGMLQENWSYLMIPLLVEEY